MASRNMPSLPIERKKAIYVDTLIYLNSLTHSIVKLLMNKLKGAFYAEGWVYKDLVLSSETLRPLGSMDFVFVGQANGIAPVTHKVYLCEVIIRK